MYAAHAQEGIRPPGRLLDVGAAAPHRRTIAQGSRNRGRYGKPSHQGRPTTARGRPDTAASRQSGATRQAARTDDERVGSAGRAAKRHCDGRPHGPARTRRPVQSGASRSPPTRQHTAVRTTPDATAHRPHGTDDPPTRQHTGRTRPTTPRRDSTQAARDRRPPDATAHRPHGTDEAPRRGGSHGPCRRPAEGSIPRSAQIDRHHRAPIHRKRPTTA